MTSEQFAREIVALTDTLYRVSYSILREACDREDAVQSLSLIHIYSASLQAFSPFKMQFVQPTQKLGQSFGR